MRLYFKYIKHQFKAGFSYRASSVMTMIGQFLGIVASLLGIYFLFDKFGSIGEYSFNDILITYAIVFFVFSVDEMFFRGFDEFDKLVCSGDLDRLLLRPRNLVLQICGYKVEIVKTGLLFGNDNKKQEKQLNAAGEFGWKLVCISEGKKYAKYVYAKEKI